MDEATLFQAASISKPVAALAALHLSQYGNYTLDENVNDKLKSWKVPDNEFTAKQKVTVRELLSHSAGLTVHGFPGYAASAPLPTLVQILNGEKPANTAPIRVNVEPGTLWRYSGGGYTVVQQLMIDRLSKPFPAILQMAVLGPVGMEAQYLRAALARGSGGERGAGASFRRRRDRGALAYLSGDGGGGPVDDAVGPGAVRDRGLECGARDFEQGGGEGYRGGDADDSEGAVRVGGGD